MPLTASMTPNFLSASPATPAGLFTAAAVATPFTPSTAMSDSAVGVDSPFNPHDGPGQPSFFRPQAL